MEAITEWTMDTITMHGAPILVFVTFFGSLGIPFPNSMVIVSAGAFARMGVLDWRLALPACLAGTTLADNSEYLLGYLAQPWLERRFGEKNVWKQAHSTMNQQGGWAILLTRFWLTPLAPAINVLAGNRYPYGQFLVFDIVGKFLWVLLYGGLGYLFAAQWEWVSEALGVFSWISVLLVFIACGVYYLLVKRRETQEAD